MIDFYFSAIILIMKTIAEIRLSNFRRLLGARNLSLTAFARDIGMSLQQVSQVAGARPMRNIGDMLARRIEAHFGTQPGWLDHNHSKVAWAGKAAAEDQQPSQGISAEQLVTVSATLRGNGTEGTQLAEEEKPRPLNMLKTSASMYAVKVDSDAYSHRIRRGECIVVDPQRHIKSGDDALVQVEGGEVEIAQYLFTRNGTLMFDPLDGSGKHWPLPDTMIVSVCPVVAIISDVLDDNA